jgi:hypothetical protein
VAFPWRRSGRRAAPSSSAQRCASLPSMTAVHDTAA